MSLTAIIGMQTNKFTEVYCNLVYRYVSNQYIPTALSSNQMKRHSWIFF